MQQTTSPVIYEPYLWIRIAALKESDFVTNRTPVFTLGFPDQVVQFAPLTAFTSSGEAENSIQFLGGASRNQLPAPLSKIRIGANRAGDRAIDIQLNQTSPFSVTVQGESGWQTIAEPLVNPVESMLVGINLIDLPAGFGYHGSFENNATVFPDGTMICIKSVPVHGAVKTAREGQYETASEISLGNWYAPFCTQPSVFYSLLSADTSAEVKTSQSPTSGSAGSVLLTRQVPADVSGTIRVTAIGRWYLAKDF